MVLSLPRASHMPSGPRWTLVNWAGNGPHPPVLVPAVGSSRPSDDPPLAKTTALPSGVKATFGNWPAAVNFDTGLRVATSQTRMIPSLAAGMAPAASRLPSSENASDRTTADARAVAGG